MNRLTDEIIRALPALYATGPGSFNSSNRGGTKASNNGTKPTTRRTQRMTSGQVFSRRMLAVPLLLLPVARGAQGQAADPHLTLVRQALAVELRAAGDTQHPMRYRLHKVSPRLSTTKDIAETKDGAVARLVAMNDKPLNSLDEQKEAARLDALLADPGKQRHRKQSEDADTARALKVLRALPDAFDYKYTGPCVPPSEHCERFSFQPNSNFDPPDLETHALAHMAGEIWIDPVEQRVLRLQGRLQQDVDFGWGMLGRLNKGGWIIIDQSDIGNHQWRIVRFQMVMSGRVFFKTRSFDTLEEETDFAALPPGIGYAQAIQMLRSEPDKTSGRER
jgi:hypothetical protein